MSRKAAAAGSSSVVECTVWSTPKCKYIDISLWIYTQITYFLIDYRTRSLARKWRLTSIMAHFKNIDQTEVTDLTRITISNAKFYQTLILQNSTFIKDNTHSIYYLCNYIFYSYAICITLSHLDSAIHTLHLHAPTEFEDNNHINKGLNQLRETTGSKYMP